MDEARRFARNRRRRIAAAAARKGRRRRTYDRREGNGSRRPHRRPTFPYLHGDRISLRHAAMHSK